MHEPAQRRVMELYARAGQPRAALRQYQEWVRLLEQELGLAPQAEMVQPAACMGDNEPAYHFSVQAVELCEAEEDIPSCCRALSVLASILQQLEQYDRAYHVFQTCLRLAHEIEDGFITGLVLTNLGVLFLYTGRSEEAIQHLEQALVYDRAGNDTYGAAVTLSNLGHVWLAKYDAARAGPYYRQSLLVSKDLEICDLTASNLEGLAGVAVFARRPPAARRCCCVRRSTCEPACAASAHPERMPWLLSRWPLCRHNERLKIFRLPGRPAPPWSGGRRSSMLSMNKLLPDRAKGCERCKSVATPAGIARAIGCECYRRPQRTLTAPHGDDRIQRRSFLPLLGGSLLCLTTMPETKPGNHIRAL